MITLNNIPSPQDGGRPGRGLIAVARARATCKLRHSRILTLVDRIEANRFTAGLLFAAVIATILFFPTGGH